MMLATLEFSLKAFAGLFDWSMHYQDGTQPADRQPMDENKRKW
jgi:hypothetical protein